MIVSAALRKRATDRITELVGQTLEEEVRTMDVLAPEVLARLPIIFGDSVMDSLMSILGEESGEALIRIVGDVRFMTPEEAYESLDEIFHSGSEILKAAIREELRVRVHRLYKETVGMAPPSSKFR
jgi:hypothetical protein